MNMTRDSGVSMAGVVKSGSNTAIGNTELSGAHQGAGCVGPIQVESKGELKSKKAPETNNLVQKAVDQGLFCEYMNAMNDSVMSGRANEALCASSGAASTGSRWRGGRVGGGAGRTRTLVLVGARVDGATREGKEGGGVGGAKGVGTQEGGGGRDEERK